MRGLALLLAIAATPLSAAEPSYTLRFKDITKEAGLYEPLAGIMGHGAAWGDFDNDGKPDLYIGGFCDRPDAEYKPAKGPVPNHLFRNLGNGKFEVVKQPAVSYFGRTSGAVFADLDNDGWLELYAANNARAKAGKKAMEPQASSQTVHAMLFHNQKGQFVNISNESGACPQTLYTARNIGVLDYDGDGLLDLLVVEDRFTAKPRTTLFKNMGGMKFKDVTKEAGLPEDLYGLGLAVADLNGDGRPDFFVPHSNRLFLSEGKDRYREAVELKPILDWKPLDREDWPCGAHFVDLNRDGRLDLVLTIHGKTARNKVFLNMGLKDGMPQFKDVTKEVGLGDPVPVKCPHVEIQDFDNDGFPDIYMSAAWLDDDGKVTPLVYRNTGIGKDGLPHFIPPREIKGPMVYYPTGPSCDFDGDGKIDLFLVNWFQGNHCRLLKNESQGGNWIDVRVKGTTMNAMGIGSQVKIYKTGMLGKPAGLLGFQEITTGYGYAGGQQALAHFGLGDEKEVDVLITFPSGKTSEMTKVKAGRMPTVVEPK